MTVMAFYDWKTNGKLIFDVQKLGYLPEPVLDATYGEGKFWTEFRPQSLTTNDLYKPADLNCDFRTLPLKDRSFQTVVYDPPFKLSGAPALGEFDDRYGINKKIPWQEKVVTILEGAVECARVADRFLLVKTQDQICSGKPRWLTDEITNTVTRLDFWKRDRFDMLSYRPQPTGRSQKHARRNTSTLLVFERCS